MSAAGAAPHRSPLSPIDRSATGRWALVASLAWGFAEATVFFIVPDVLLMWIASRSLRAGMKASVVAIVGALAGGSLMHGLGARSPEHAEALVEQVPAISRSMIDEVREETARAGLGAVLLGPLQGQPYKIYAVEWGARRGGLPAFLLVSIPARGVRFVLCVLFAHFAFRALARFTRRRARIEAVILVAGWTLFYGFYFAHFGA
jgi:hypothetical protein